MLERLKRKIRSFGWPDTCWFVADTFLRRVSFGSARLVKYYFVAQPVAERADEHSRSGSMQIYVTETLDDVICQAPRPVQTMQKRFDQRSRCVVAERDGVFAGFIWLCPEQYREDTVRCDYRWTPPRSAVWDFDVFVAPPFRMGRLFQRLWAHTHGLLAAENVRWTLSRIDALNPGSLAAHRKLGARDVARGWFLIAGQFQITVASAAPYLHVSLRDGDAPQICFDLSRLETESDRAS